MEGKTPSQPPKNEVEQQALEEVRNKKQRHTNSKFFEVVEKDLAPETAETAIDRETTIKIGSRYAEQAVHCSMMNAFAELLDHLDIELSPHVIDQDGINPEKASEEIFEELDELESLDQIYRDLIKKELKTKYGSEVLTSSST